MLPNTKRWLVYMVQSALSVGVRMQIPRLLTVCATPDQVSLNGNSLNGLGFSCSLEKFHSQTNKASERVETVGHFSSLVWI